MKTIRWGIIGCGNVTEVKSGPGLQKATNSTLVAVMRRNGALAQDYAARHNVPKWYTDAQALIDDPAVDAVYIATPPNAHKEYTLAVAKAGKPVYVEKPMALSLDECRAMARAANQAGTVLVTGPSHSFDAPVRRPLNLAIVLVREASQSDALTVAVAGVAAIDDERQFAGATVIGDQFCQRID